MTELEQKLLKQVDDQQQITFNQATILQVAGLLGTTSAELAKAKNALRDAGYVDDQHDVFTQNASVVSITPAGKAALQGTTSSAKPIERKPWWKFWSR